MSFDAIYNSDVWMNFHPCISHIANLILLLKTPIFAHSDKHTSAGLLTKVDVKLVDCFCEVVGLIVEVVVVNYIMNHKSV